MISYGSGQYPDMQALRDQGELCQACRFLFLQGYYYRCNLHKSKQESKPMKKYRCKIKTPLWDKGEIVEKNTGLIPNRYYVGDPEDFPDLFEEIPDRWVPGYGERYFTIIDSYNDGEFMVEEMCWDGHEFDIIRLKQNRVFRTKEKAEEVLNKILQVLEENKEV